MHCAIGVLTHSAVHKVAEPSMVSSVQVLLSLQSWRVLGQSGPSHFSYPSVILLPQTSMQSLSVNIVQFFGHTPSSFKHAIGV